jgi:hypothetical protein
MMTYCIDMVSAARRHLEAADELAQGKRQDVAGYLYGIAAECALKAMMCNAGFRPVTNEKQKKDPFFAHFPELRTILRDRIHGRGATPLVRLVQNDGFMNNWSTQMRYSHGKDIQKKWIENWAKDARQAVTSIGV